MSLFQRAQARLNNKENEIVFEDSDEEEDSESDIDDNITLDECMDMVQRKSQDVNSSFTRIRQLHQEGMNKNTNLKEVLSKRIQKSKDSQLPDAGSSSEATNENNHVFSEPSQDSLIYPNSENYSWKTYSTSSQSQSTYATNSQSQSTYATNSQSQSTYATNSQSQNSIDIVESQSQYTLEMDSQGQEVPVKKKRGKLTDEERKRREEVRLEKKRLREAEKIERQKKREEAKLEKELQKEKLKAEKQAATMNKRSERKEECMGKIIAVVDPSLIEGANGADILKGLQDLGVRYEIKTLPFPSCIGWMKENATYSADGKAVTKDVHFEEEQQVLHKMTANELAYRVNNELAEETEETLSLLVKELKKGFPNKKLTILLTGLNTYYRLHKTKQNRDFRAQALGYDEHAGKKRKKKSDKVPILQQDEIEGLLVQVQTLYDDIFIRKCEETKHIGEFIVSFTRAIAEAPFKKEANSSLKFCSIGPSDKMSIKVMDDGDGILQLWNQQLQQFFGVRHETSTVITQQYPTPRSLVQITLPE
uniref:ERCC4 domain-containing protein n=1 Tax=Clytia hemisphaerica TaxID=252671 RepID=A0A7M5UA01_9CNID